MVMKNNPIRNSIMIKPKYTSLIHYNGATELVLGYFNARLESFPQYSLECHCSRIGFKETFGIFS